MSNTEKPTRTEHASVLWRADFLEEHFLQPRALVGRVECIATDRDGEPVDQSGELAVLTNVPGHLPIELAFAYPYKDFDAGHRRTFLGRASLEPNTARALASYLNEAADRADPPDSMVPGCVPCACGSRVLQRILVQGIGRGAGTLYQISCPCGMRSPSESTEHAAVARWNSMMGGA